MNVLHILPNQRTADILRRSGVSKENIYAFPVLLAESDRSLWKNFIPNDIKQYDRIIVWHGNDANSLLIYALFCMLDVPLWHIDAYQHQNHLFKHHVTGKRKTIQINMTMMTDIGARVLYGNEQKVRWWQVLWNKRQWKKALLFPNELIQRNLKGLCYFGKDKIEALCLSHITQDYQPMTSVLAKMMTHLELYHEYVSEGYLVQCLRKLEGEGKLEIRPTTGAKIKFGSLTDVNYEIKRITIK